MLIEEIVTNIDARIAALKSEIQPLCDAKAALLGEAAGPGSAPPRRINATNRQKAAPAEPENTVANAQTEADVPTPAPKRRARRAAAAPKVEPVSAEKIAALLGGSDGLAATALAERAAGRVDQVRALLNEMSDSGQVRRSGERRATRWHLVTDEDRIAERAAQLEAQSIARGSRNAEEVTVGAHTEQL